MPFLLCVTKINEFKFIRGTQHNALSLQTFGHGGHLTLHLFSDDITHALLLSLCGLDELLYRGAVC